MTSKKKIIGILLLVVSALMASALIINSMMSKSSSQSEYGNLVAVKGIIGSEKSDFFNDPAVQKIFKENGLNVEVTTAGSLETR